MKSYIFYTVIFCAIYTSLAEFGTNHTFLKEKPHFLKSCHRNNNNVNAFEHCIVQAFQNLFTTWSKGVSNSKAIDPLTLSQLTLIDDRERIRNGPQLLVKVLDPVTTGLAAAKVLNISMKENDYSFKMRYSVPLITVRGNYSAMGQISLLQLDTFGAMNIEIENGTYTIITKVQLRTYENTNIVYFDIKALKCIINDIENVRLNFSNLFKDESLTKNTNLMFNEQWRVFFDIFKPRLEETISIVLLDVLRSVFAVIPADYFIADVKKQNKINK